MSSADEPMAVWQHEKQAADDAFKNNRFNEAAAHYTKVIKALNDDKSTRPAIADRKVYANRSLAYCKMGDFKEALNDAQEAGKLPGFRGDAVLSSPGLSTAGLQLQLSWTLAGRRDGTGWLALLMA